MLKAEGLFDSPLHPVGYSVTFLLRLRTSSVFGWPLGLVAGLSLRLRRGLIEGSFCEAAGVAVMVAVNVVWNCRIRWASAHAGNRGIRYGQVV